MTVTPPIETWGSDHWSTLGYLETRVVDHRGVLGADQLRGMVGVRGAALGQHPERRPAKYPTRLADGTEVHAHDDVDCISDMIAVGLLETIHTDNNQIRDVCEFVELPLHEYVETSIENEQNWQLTALGLEVAADLRGHKARGGSWAEFSVAMSMAFRSRLVKSA